MWSLLRLSTSLLLATLISPFISPAEAAPTDVPSAQSFYIQHLPDLHQDDSHPLHLYSGHISSDPNAKSAPSTEVTAHLFFVLVRARRTADKERVLFWFNGGPGCSSFDGLMMEVGPWRVDGQGGFHTVDGGWEEYTNMVFLDQPAGTGYSYTSTDKYVHELGEAAQQVIEFMRNFYQIFPEFADMDTYLGGESYAGQWIPYTADAILNSNLPTRLMGAAIGNAWTDARRQYPAYLEYAVKHGIIEENSDAWKKSKDAVDACDEIMKGRAGEPVHINKCEEIMSVIGEVRHRKVDNQEVCMNVYDVRLDDEWPACGMNWPVDLKQVTPYLQRDDVKSAFHASAKSESWVECSGRVGRELSNENSESSITLVPGILERTRMMFFNGDQDFICNYIGTENMISAMTWNGERGLGTVETKSWSVAGTPAGTWVESRNLTYVKIFNVSHMAPYDAPHVAHDMILRFMNVNFSAIVEGSARIPSRVGDQEKPSFNEEIDDETGALIPVPPGKTPEQDKAMWEAYYNAGSAALVLVLIALAIGVYLLCRRRRRVGAVALGTKEENIPLSQSVHNRGEDDEEIGLQPNGKGKGRADEETVFEIADSDEDDDASPHNQRHS